MYEVETERGIFQMSDKKRGEFAHEQRAKNLLKLLFGMNRWGGMVVTGVTKKVMVIACLVVPD